MLYLAKMDDAQHGNEKKVTIRGKKFHKLLLFPSSVMPWNLTSKQCTGAVAQKMHRGLKHKTIKEDISECTAASYRTDITSRLLQYLIRIVRLRIFVLKWYIYIHKTLEDHQLHQQETNVLSCSSNQNLNILRLLSLEKGVIQQMVAPTSNVYWKGRTQNLIVMHFCPNFDALGCK